MKRAIMTVATLAAFAAASIPAIADDTGAASMHDLRKEGGRSCMVSHIHAGTGEGKTKATATSAAIKEWYAYTAGEYGSDWASWGKIRRQENHLRQSRCRLELDGRVASLQIGPRAKSVPQ